MSELNEIIIFLATAVITVPFFKKLGLGSILGYLTAGIIVGPSVTGLISEVEHTRHFAEWGVVFLLFIIGLELELPRLKKLRKPIFSMGSQQFLCSAILIFAVAIALGQSLLVAFVISLCLPLSSTAFAVQMLTEKNEFLTLHGRSAFAILLFQDMAVIPIIALLPLLASSGFDAESGHFLLGMGKAIAVITMLILAGHFLIKPFLGLVASAKSRELFSAASLLVVLGTAATVHAVGLSMALGAFLAGVMLADSEFKHELEANIEPFKGLLLGLFFIAVGMSVDLSLFYKAPLVLLGLTLGLIVIKSFVLYFIGRLNKLNHHSSLKLAVAISQGGEFAFVILGIAISQHIIAQSLVDMMILVVTLSMALTPLLSMLLSRYFKHKHKNQGTPEYDHIEDDTPKVIIAGFGRFGQIIARILLLKKIHFTALEANFEQVDFVRKFGNKVYFGDATRLDMLRAAGADKAEVIVLSIVNLEASLKTASVAKKHFPNLKIFARARNRQHAYKLMDIGVDYVIRETFLSSIELAKEVLLGLGLIDKEALRVTQAFREHDENLVAQQHLIHHDEKRLIASAKDAALELEGLFSEDSLTGIDKGQE